ncbi:serine hydrolase domain-containing protein [Mucilaginibacter frigoritolerans]|jgi:CubicO group peptidase (beta-lactamase class C family)|nr:serine hydrolase [Mucilaginibacter frigoritolerans]
MKLKKLFMRHYYFLVLLMTCSLQLSAQQNDIVKTQGITSALHQNNIGQIIFTEKAITAAELKKTDFLSAYTLTNKSNLFITVFMGNSLTNYMHQLAPELNADSLVKIGCYQFSLFIDDHLVYSSNLHPGAPYGSIKNFETIISKPLINYQAENTLWTQSFWGRFMHFGGDSALTEGKHLLRMEIRPYVQLATLKVGNLIAKGELNITVNRKPKIDLAKINLNPVKAYDGFPVSTEKLDSNKIKELKAYIDAAVFKNISSVVVIKNGKLLVEEYFNGEGRDTLHDPRSVGKSFASAITGIAMGEGYLKSEDQTLKEFYDLKSFDHYSPLKEEVSIKNLLTMSSVFDGNDDIDASPGNEENMYPTDNWVKFALSVPVSLTRPKDEWHYFTAGVILLGDILNKTVPGGLDKYADEKLFKPLNIRDYKWQYTPQHVPNTAGGIRLKALDFAKFGQLYKNDGKWNSKQVIPKFWIEKTFTKYKALPGRNGEYYGYLFWNKKYVVKNKAYETFYCAGNGGNSIFVFKDQPLVIVITATAYGAPYAHPQVDQMMERYILPAVIDTN